VGSPRNAREAGVDLSSVAARIDALSEGGATPIIVSEERRLVGVLALSDPPKPDSSKAVAMLRKSGRRVIMLTGDNVRTATAVAALVGIDEIEAEVLPGEKADRISELQAKGARVVMVGDGINDAPALAAADLGIAIGSGSDVAIESADVVLVGSDLRGVPRAVLLSRATLRTIKQNLVWAFAYNVLLIPLAAGALVPLLGFTLPPASAAAAMAASSVSVVTNSLRLRNFRP